MSERIGPPALSPETLRWRCDPATLPFASTAELEPEQGVIGQETAVEALRFGLDCRAPGQNIFVRGLTGTGRMTLVRRLLEEMRPSCPAGVERCYVHNFAHPDRPRLVSVPPGQARMFRRSMDELADFVRDDMQRALQADSVTARRAAIDQRAQDEAKALIEPFERSAREAGLGLVSVQMGPIVHSTLFPIVDGKPVPPEEYLEMHGRGEVTDEQLEKTKTLREKFEKQLEKVNKQVGEIRRGHNEEMRQLMEREAREILREFVHRIQAQFPQPAVKTFLSEVVDDVVDRGLRDTEDDANSVDFTRLYRVNVLLERSGDQCPIIVENAPTIFNLLGTVDREIAGPGLMRSDHLMIRAGSLLRADGGYLIMEARELLSEPGAWRILTRTLRAGCLEIVPTELSLPLLGHAMKPEPIDIDVKIILIGDAEIYYMLDALDADFPNHFKLLADFDSTIDRNDDAFGHYAGVLTRIVQEEKLPPFDRTAIAALVEHGARIASRNEKLTARFGRLSDLARESAYVAGKAGRAEVSGEDVREAVLRTKRRAGLPSRRFRELISDGTIRIETSGREVGQINGLAVIQAGSLTSGFPARITATIGPGTAGVINIEREAALSGAIHTKGFYILGGLLRHLLRTDHPLAFDASIAFEQSYGGIDGDSASGAEICCLLSALTGVPIDQQFAMTGAIDQVGHIMSIGAVNEKIEGFFDVCMDVGMTGAQAVIIPTSNVGDLMLRLDVVEACGAGKFSVHAVETVQEALELLTGVPAEDLLGTAVERAKEFWLKAAIRPKRKGGAAEEEGD